jgi:predicted dinucleotide-binding enzyme
MPPSLFVCNTDSLGEQIQRALPGVKVVKALNTVTAALMVNPRQLADGDHDLFVCGDDAAARAQATALLREWFGWRRIVDLGGISSARATEMYLPIWLRLRGALGTGLFNVRVVQQGE